MVSVNIYKLTDQISNVCTNGEVRSSFMVSATGDAPFCLHAHPSCLISLFALHFSTLPTRASCASHNQPFPLMADSDLFLSTLCFSITVDNNIEGQVFLAYWIFESSASWKKKKTFPQRPVVGLFNLSEINSWVKVNHMPLELTVLLNLA